MADRNQLKVADRHGIADDDPFAELTRIMGFDPREPVRPQTPTRAVPAEASDDPFDIDLEKELMGDLAGFDDEPVSAAPAAIEQPAHEVEAEAPQAEWTGEIEPAAEHDLDLHAAMDEHVAASLGEDFAVEDEAGEAVESEFYAEPEAVEAAHDTTEPVADEAGDYVPAAEFEFDDITAESLSAEPQHVEAEAAEDAYAAPAEVAAAPMKGASDDDFAAYFDGAMADVDMDFAARTVAPAVHQEAPEAVASEDEALDDDVFQRRADAVGFFVNLVPAEAHDFIQERFDDAVAAKLLERLAPSGVGEADALIRFVEE